MRPNVPMNGGFVSRQQIAPNTLGQVQRFGPTQTLHMVHYDTPLCGTAQTLSSEERLFASSNRLGNADLCSLKENGKFSDWKQFVIYGIGVMLHFSAEVGQTAAADGAAVPIPPLAANENADPDSTLAIQAFRCYKLACYDARIEVQIQDSTKQVLWVDQLPGGGGLAGSITTGITNTAVDTANQAFGRLVTNGVPVAGGFFKLKESIIITPQNTFAMVLKWQGSKAGAQTQALTEFNGFTNVEKLFRIYIHGIEGRDVING